MKMQSVDELIGEYAVTEAAAQDVLSDKQQIVELDGKRNKGREALRQLKNSHSGAKPGEVKSWVCFGNTFMKMDTAACVEMLETDQKTIDSEINSLRDGLKPKVSRLHQLEGRAQVKGFDLKGMNTEELRTISK